MRFWQLGEEGRVKFWMATEMATETEMGMEMARRKNRVRHKKAYMSGEKFELEIRNHPVKIEKVPLY